VYERQVVGEVVEVWRGGVGRVRGWK